MPQAQPELPERLQLPPALARELVATYGSPLYVYDETILRRRCREMAALVPRPCFRPSYSAKANANPALLAIIREEGLRADAMSPGEIAIALAAGFKPEEIFFVSNNISAEEMRHAAAQGVLTSVDSLSQLALFAKAVPGGRVAVRINPGVGDGHNEKVVTGGHSKFGVPAEEAAALRALAKQEGVRIVGLNQHIGSLFLKPDAYLAAADVLLAVAETFPGLAFVDFGGGMGVPYQACEARLDLAALAAALTRRVDAFLAKPGRAHTAFYTEPGRYVVAECGQLLGTVHSTKQSYGTRYVGTDLGFNTLMRQVLYNAWHDIVVYSGEADAHAAGVPHDSGTLREADSPVPGATAALPVTVTGNICESGDILAENRPLPPVKEGDLVGVLNAGAYGSSMASNYNARLRPAEVLLCQNGAHRLIRRRDTIEDLMRNFV